MVAPYVYRLFITHCQKATMSPSSPVNTHVTDFDTMREVIRGFCAVYYVSITTRQEAIMLPPSPDNHEVDFEVMYKDIRDFCATKNIALKLPRVSGWLTDPVVDKDELTRIFATAKSHIFAIALQRLIKMPIGVLFKEQIVNDIRVNVLVHALVVYDLSLTCVDASGIVSAHQTKQWSDDPLHFMVTSEASVFMMGEQRPMAASDECMIAETMAFIEQNCPFVTDLIPNKVKGKPC